MGDHHRPWKAIWKYKNWKRKMPHYKTFNPWVRNLIMYNKKPFNPQFLKLYLENNKNPLIPLKEYVQRPLYNTKRILGKT